ncbi:UNVERIFIED_CONTAM: hypothetical protein Scaly_0029400 [Sesamum calycinum]|uniref:Coiled-coil domain-containing protein 86 n=1 Tax=Sesamum calycinum TaxID=2727403 RepID=A0AAW2ST96_9LAMI
MACTIDFRRLDEGFGGKTFKRKRSEQEAEKLQVLNPSSEAPPHHDSMDVDTGDRPSAKRQAVQSSDDPNKPSFGKPTYDGNRGKVSGRKERGSDTSSIGSAVREKKRR